MAPHYDSRKVTLGRGLDREIYQIVRKFIEEQEQYDGRQQVRLSVTTVYEKIKKSNSSLNRKSKRLLQDSIERALGTLRKEAGRPDEGGSLEGDFDDILDEDVLKVRIQALPHIIIDANSSRRLLTV